jgi:hypothetical protein
MTTQTERPTKVYTCLVEEKAEGPEGSILSLEIPAFDSKYPTKITRVEPELAQRLELGATYDLLLERQNLKRGKEGDKAYDWYWGLKAIAGAGEVRQPARDAPQGPAVAPRGMPAGVGEVDPTRRSIERQTALKAAVELAVARINTGMIVNDSAVVEGAAYLYDWLSGSNGATKPAGGILDEEFPPEERFEEQEFLVQ